MLRTRTVRPVLLAALLVCLGVRAQSATATPAEPALPATVAQVLHQARLPAHALAVVVQEVGNGPTRLSLNADQPLNPASLTKLVTTYAALDLLGPAWTWRTSVWLQGSLRRGVLDGSLVIKGYGDPKWVVERLWLLLRQVRQQGVREIRGDIVLDQSAFVPEPGSSADFDDEPLRPYNTRAQALLLNQRTVQYRFVPDPARGIATIGSEPPLTGVRVPAQVPLAAGPCGDWREQLDASFTDPAAPRFAGRFAASCGERQWPLAFADPASYDARLLKALWRDAGGRLTGTVREGAAPTAQAPSFELQSPPLAEVVRDINKFSNNVMAQQLFLTLALEQRGLGTPESAREVLQQWWAGRVDASLPPPLIDNGSGLSRQTRVSAAQLARLLQSAWASPVMPELMASLPVIGLDGTLRRAKAATGRAHLKSGSLRDVVALAGYVLGASGRRYVLVAIINAPEAQAGRAALDALVAWTAADRSER